MENRNEEHIIEDVLFEISAREVLAKAEQSSTGVVRPIRRYLAYAAGIIALIAAVFIMRQGASSQTDRIQRVAEVYDYPSLALSRSAERSIIDDHLDDFNTKKVDEVIASLTDKDLDEKDRYALAHVYFEKGAYQKSKDVIVSKEWKEEYYRSEMDWLLFLIAFIQDDQAEQTSTKAKLTPAYKAEAESLLKLS